MKCEKCSKEFPAGKHKAMLYSFRTERIYYFCSKKCSKEFEKEYPLSQFMRFYEGGEINE